MTVTFNDIRGLTELGQKGCLQCGEKFAPKKSIQKCCGYECANSIRRVIHDKKHCPICGILFIPVSKKQKYCGFVCWENSVRARQTGKGNCNWRGGTSVLSDILRGSVEFSEWRRWVFQRDAYTCQECGEHASGKLSLHHILSFTNYPDRRFDVENGVTLCYGCHKQLHRVYGMGGLVIPWCLGR